MSWPPGWWQTACLVDKGPEKKVKSGNKVVNESRGPDLGESYKSPKI